MIVDNIEAEKGFRGPMTYTHSKSVLEAMSVVLAQDMKPANVSVNIVFPGRVSTAMTKNLTSGHLPGPMKLMLPFFKCFFREDGGKSAKQAAHSTVWGCTSGVDSGAVTVGATIAGATGKHFDTHCKEQTLHKNAYDSAVHKAVTNAIGKALGDSLSFCAHALSSSGIVPTSAGTGCAFRIRPTPENVSSIIGKTTDHRQSRSSIINAIKNVIREYVASVALVARRKRGTRRTRRTRRTRHTHEVAAAELHKTGAVKIEARLFLLAQKQRLRSQQHVHKTCTQDLYTHVPATRGILGYSFA
jgi:hypothetical protein